MENMNYYSVHTDMDIRDALNKNSNGQLERFSEMTRFQHGFLCGLIEETKPKKILEIGVAAGGTTTVILDCLEKNNIQAEMFSVDISVNWYRGGEKRSGYLKEQIIPNNKINHKFILGRAIPYVIDEIGEDIDMLILDTAHVLPGELLDFLVCYPYLKKDAIVVLHDVLDNIISGEKTEIATKILFDVIGGDKYYMIGGDEYYRGFSNIAAIRLNEKTEESIKDLFSALTISWFYFLDEDTKNEYKKSIKRKYPESYYRWISEVFEIQECSDVTNKIRMNYGRCIDLLDINIKSSDKIFIYGAGYWGEIYTKYLLEKGIKIQGYVVSDDRDLNESVLPQRYSIPIYHLSDLVDSKNESKFVLAVDRREQKQCLMNLKAKGFTEIL